MKRKKIIKKNLKRKAKKTSSKKIIKKATKKSASKNKNKKKLSKKTKRLSSSFLKFIEEKLNKEKKRILELVNLTQHEGSNLTTGVEDEVESAETSLEKEILFALSDREKVLLNDINLALRKVRKKQYGLCESCGNKISIRRLKAMPYTRYCIKCASKI